MQSIIKKRKFTWNDSQYIQWSHIHRHRDSYNSLWVAVKVLDAATTSKYFECYNTLFSRACSVYVATLIVDFLRNLFSWILLSWSLLLQDRELMSSFMFFGWLQCLFWWTGNRGEPRILRMVGRSLLIRDRNKFSRLKFLVV